MNSDVNKQAANSLPASFVNSLGIEMVLIPAGTFILPTECFAARNRIVARKTRREVTLPEPFYLSRHPVTNAQWRQFVDGGGAPEPVGEHWVGPDEYEAEFRPWQDAEFGGANRPVVCISLNQVYDFCRWLGDKEGRQYGVPWLPEWEYACRAGSGATFPWGDVDIDPTRANYGGSALNHTTDVGSYPPNALGLCDMLGNVWEQTESFRPLRYDIKMIKGGSYRSRGLDVEPSGWSTIYWGTDREIPAYNTRRSDMGFRLRCAVPGSKNLNQAVCEQAAAVEAGLPWRFGKPRREPFSIKLHEAVTVKPYEAQGIALKLNDGDILNHNRWSTDNGRTWGNWPNPDIVGDHGLNGRVIETIEKIPTVGVNRLTQLRDGTILICQQAVSRKAGALGHMHVWCSEDNLRTAGHFEATIDVPQTLKGIVGDHGYGEDVGSFENAFLEMPDGSLLSPMYGCLEDETQDRLASETYEVPYASWLVRSQDKGRSWQYYSTIAYEPSMGLEGFCEGSLIRLPDSMMLCALRNTGNGRLVGSGLYMTWSCDDGKTWSLLPQRVFCDYEPITGIWPQLVYLPNGVLALSTGRPGLRIMFSPDGEGRCWTQQIEFPQGPADHNPLSGGGEMATLIGIDDNELLFTYSGPKGVTAQRITVDFK